MSAVRTASGLTTIAAISYRDAASALIDISASYVRDALNASKAFFESISAGVSPSSVKGYGNTGGPVDITTPTATCTVLGGVAPITYLWTRTDGGGDSWTIGDATAATTAFTAEAIEVSSTATFICTCTDDTGAIAVSGEVAARAINLGGGV